MHYRPKRIPPTHRLDGLIELRYPLDHVGLNLLVENERRSRRKASSLIQHWYKIIWEKRIQYSSIQMKWDPRNIPNLSFQQTFTNFFLRIFNNNSQLQRNDFQRATIISFDRLL